MQATRRQATSFPWAAVLVGIVVGMLGPHEPNWAGMGFSYYYPEPGSPAQLPVCRLKEPTGDSLRSDLILHEALQEGIPLRSVALGTHLPLYFTQLNDF